MSEPHESWTALEVQMHQGGYYFHPNWCQKSDEELENESHVGPWHEVVAGQFGYRARAWTEWDSAWEETAEDVGSVELNSTHDGALRDGALYNAAELDAIVAVIERARTDLANPGDCPGTSSGKWDWTEGYPGAFEDWDNE